MLSRDPDQVLEAGRARQRAYMQHNALAAAREREWKAKVVHTHSEHGGTRLSAARMPRAVASEPGMHSGFLDVVA